MSEKNLNNIVSTLKQTKPNLKLVNHEQAQPHFVRTINGISRIAQGKNQPIEVPITTDGLCPKIKQVVRVFLANGEEEKIRVLQLGKKECRVNSEAWRKPNTIAREIDRINHKTGRLITKQEVYLAEALESLDEKEALVTTEYRFCGWHQGRFLIPNSPELEPNETVISDLPYGYCEGNIELSKEALSTLLSTSPSHAALLFATILLAPLIRPLHLQRFGMYLSARAGTGKTEMLKLLMCVYGNRWSGDELLSFAGTTDNAAIKLATSARDLPFPIDNFRPQEGQTPLLKRITTAAIEGKSKARLDRLGEFKEQTEIACLPIITGEDFPEGDAGLLGRYLVVDFNSTKRLDSSKWLNLKRQIEKNLPMLGKEWISYIQTQLLSKEENEKIEDNYKLILDYWQKRVKEKGYSSVQNIERIIKHISSLQLAWELAIKCPIFSEILGKYSLDFSNGCIEMLENMIGRNEAKSLGNIAIELLQDALTTKTVFLQKAGFSISNPSPRQENLGWQLEDETVHLIPNSFIGWLQKQSAPIFGNLSSKAFYKALEQEGWIHSRDHKQYTKVIKTDGKTCRILHLRLSK